MEVVFKAKSQHGRLLIEDHIAWRKYLEMMPGQVDVVLRPSTEATWDDIRKLYWAILSAIEESAPGL